MRLGWVFGDAVELDGDGAFGGGAAVVEGAAVGVAENLPVLQVRDDAFDDHGRGRWSD